MTSAWVGVDQDLLVVRVEFALNATGGRITRLTVAPVEGYTPDPGEVRIRKKRHGKKKGSGVNWDGAGS